MTTLALFGQVVAAGSILQWLILAIVIIAGIGVVYLVAKRAGFPIPDWFVQIVGIIVLAFVAVIALKLLWSLLF
jgi:hypothetical protein